MSSMHVNPFDLALEALHQSRFKLQFVARTKTSIITPDQPLHSPQKNDVKLHSFYLKPKNPFARFSRKNGLLFIPSVGPGYDDTKIRPWNAAVSKDR